MKEKVNNLEIDINRMIKMTQRWVIELEKQISIKSIQKVTVDKKYIKIMIKEKQDMIK